ncbi:hypothetical protein J2S02_005146 [Metabacillus niabensis]|uniref:Uncharacterized protein n=1 Tax=Metabacillus niabensis TaxID=324854 RepID=A0ABT9Z8Z1_9BACI|nr:hypothetical protein [Metabacillus niabensis]
MAIGKGCLILFTQWMKLNEIAFANKLPTMD